LHNKIYEAVALFVQTTNYVSTVAKESCRKLYLKTIGCVMVYHVHDAYGGHIVKSRKFPSFRKV